MTFGQKESAHASRSEAYAL